MRDDDRNQTAEDNTGDGATTASNKSNGNGEDSPAPDITDDVEAGIVEPLSLPPSQAPTTLISSDGNNTAVISEHDVIHKSLTSSSFIDHIKFVVGLKSDTVFSTWYNEKGKAINNYTFQQLWDEAGHCAHLLRNKWGVNRGDRVVLCYDFGLHFFAIFLGCLRAGVTAVLVYPPGPPLVKSLTKMNKVIEDCAPSLILTQTSINLLRAADRANPTSKSRSMWPSGVKYQVTDRIIRHDGFITDKTNGKNKRAKKGFLSSLISGRSSSSPPSFDEPNIVGSDLAFLQYTSGSTGNPKGVMVTHAALRANIELLHGGWLDCFENDLGDRGKIPKRITACSWLPQYHDMGLIQMGIAPLSGAFRLHMMSPVSFISNPLLWIDLISRHKCHMSAAPDFAYRLATRKFNEAKSKQTGKGHPIPNLDLSNVYHLQNAAEPTRLDTEKHFSDAFCPYGLREEWFVAGYGLAENVVGVSFKHGFHVSTIREGEDLHPSVAIAHRNTLHQSIDIIIVDPDTCVQRPENTTGEIWIAGASVAAGYYNQAQFTADEFHAKLQDPPSDGNGNGDGENAADGDSNGGRPSTKTYLRTGDYGFYQDDHLFICGRKKDIIIVNGVNYYPQDIEHAVQDASSSVRPGCVAAFSSDESGNDGQLEIVFEIRSNHTDDAATICQEIRKAVMEHIGLAPVTIAAVKERTISKTTSGKIQRRRNRQRLHDGDQKMILNFSANPNSTAQVALDGDAKTSPTETMSARNADQDEDLQSKTFNEIIANATGSQVKGDETWEDVGLSSMGELELRQSLSKRYSTTLPPNCFDMFSTLMDLETFLETSHGEPLPTRLPMLKRLTTIRNEKRLSQTTSTVIQIIGVLIILFMFALPIIPAYGIGKVLANDNRTRVVFFIDSSAFIWMCYPLVIPFWMIMLTLEVILSKWIIIGRYQEGYTNLAYSCFLRWWFVDRLMHMWENFVGRFIVGTPLMTAFCYLMGADVHRSCNIDSFIREFDLAKVDASALVSKPIRCRMFGPWKDEQGPSLRFRKILVGSNATIKGILIPGVKVGSNCYVQHVSVLAEGAQAPPNTVIRGNPGYVESAAPAAAEATTSQGSNIISIDGSDDPHQTGASTAADVDGNVTPNNNDTRWAILGGMKMTWLLVELYMTFCCFLISDILVRDDLQDWRYSKLQYWVVSIGLSSVLLVISSILLKWVMIGKKRPGKASTGIWSEFADWACDYHFDRACLILYGLTTNSIIWNLVHMAHGLDIDLRSKIFGDSFHPSEVDLITIRRSFVSIVTFHTKENGKYGRATIEDSSIGMLTTCAPGVTVRNALVSPQTHITESIIHPKPDPRNERISDLKLTGIMVASTLLYAVTLLVAAISFIPAFELWMNVIKPQSSVEAVPLVVLSVIIQTIVWTILLRVHSLITFAGSNERTAPWCLPLYMVYQSFTYSVHNWSLYPMLWGTPMINSVLRFRGVNVEGRLLYFGFRLYEPTYVTFADGCVVDECLISGHCGIFSQLTLGQSYVSGVLHQNCAIMMSTKTAATADEARLTEHGPQHLLMNSDESLVGGQARTSKEMIHSDTA